MYYRVLFFIVVIIPTAIAGVIITELHRDPAAGNKTAIPGGYSHVFVELANFSRDTLHLQNVFLTNGKAVDSVTLFDAPLAAALLPHVSAGCVFDAAYIPPGGIAVVFPRNYIAGLTAAPQSIHPVVPGTIMLTVNRNNLCGGLANDDGLALYRGTRARIDSLIDLAADRGVEISAPLSGKIVLSARQVKGVSVVPASLLLEENRRYVSSPDPKDPLTPGRVDRFEHGLYMEHSASMVSQTSARCTVAGIFAAREPAGVTWRFYSRSSSNNSITNINAGTFRASDRQFLLTFDIPLEQRQYFFEAALESSATPPQAVITLPVDLSAFWADAGTLRITEIYPRGAATADQPEWFELHNASRANVNLNGWAFGNSNGDTVEIAAADYILPAGEFAVVCRDDAAMLKKYRTIRHLIRPARWVALNNYNDTLTVWSSRRVEVDKAVYRNSWFTGWTTQSLERVGESGTDSSSWALCDRPTPGLPGGAQAWRGVSSPQMELGPIPFSPNGDGVDDVLSIRIKAPANYRVKIRIFAFSGKLLKTFTNDNEVILWDGKTESGRPAAPGPIYVVAEFTSGGGKKVIRKNGVLWR